MAARKKDHLLSVAQRMFCTRGFHAVSVDAILEEAGVARMTLYKNFGSKEDLIVATLRREDKLFRQWLASFVEAGSTRPADRIESLFAGLHERFASDGYYVATRCTGWAGSGNSTLARMNARSYPEAMPRML